MTDKDITRDVELFEARGTNLPAKQEQNSDFFTAIERLAANPDVDVAKIQQIVDMQEHILDRNAKQAFNAAMTQAQSKIELVVAREKNVQTNSLYADLKAILVKTKDVYTAEGFSLMFYEEDSPKEGHVRVCVDVMHSQGHTEKKHADVAIQTTGIAGKPMMTLVHGEQSACSYGRRRLTCMVFNIPTGEDDDGNAAGSEPDYITEEQAAELKKERETRKVDGPKFLAHFEVESIAKLPAKRFKEAMNLIKARPIPEKEAPPEREPGEDDGEMEQGELSHDPYL
ncbi:hypothetical protein ES708_00731 [subsurface metagenome]